MTNEKKLIPLTEHHQLPVASNQTKEYMKLFFVFVMIILVSVLIYNLWDAKNDLSNVDRCISIFMGVFFITFAVFKLINLKSFVDGFMMYDIFAKKSKPYAFLYPFIQLFIGIAMFAIPTVPAIQLLAAVISFVALVGVYKKVKAKEKIHCACLGNVIKMPLSTVSAFEDGIMFVLSAYMFVEMIRK